jgi:hypothetical protein
VVIAIVLLAVVAAGCGGSKQQSATPGTGGTATTGTTRRQLTNLDVINIIGPAPDTPEGAAYTTDPTATTLTLSDLRQRAQTAQERATVKAFQRAGFKSIYQRSYNGAVDVADGTAYLFRSAAGATKAFAVLKNALEKPAGVSQRVIPLAAPRLGEGAWAAHVTGDSEGAVFLWRHSSVVVVADMSCDQTCGFDVVAAARAYAQAIDARAKQVT